MEQVENGDATQARSLTISTPRPMNLDSLVILGIGTGSHSDSSCNLRLTVPASASPGSAGCAFHGRPGTEVTCEVPRRSSLLPVFASLLFLVLRFAEPTGKYHRFDLEIPSFQAVSTIFGFPSGSVRSLATMCTTETRRLRTWITM